MGSSGKVCLVSLVMLGVCLTGGPVLAGGKLNYDRARWDPIHFQPAIETAKNSDCLKCHQEILDRRVRNTSPAGVKASEALAWYETLDTYQGAQDSFHRRHLVDAYAQSVMRMQCNTCHQGNDPRDEVSGSSATTQAGLAMRKSVDPNICLMCHGQFPYQHMGLPGDWRKVGKAFNNSCLTCHQSIRTHRHQVNFLKPAAIEALGAKDSDVCFGCHGGRAWYRISYPYPRHPWKNMPPTPDWAKGRPTESEARFLVGVKVQKTASAAKDGGEKK